MDAHNLNKRVRIQERGPELDRLGQPSVAPSNWIDVMTVWASVEPMTGRERMLAQANHSELTHTVTIRYQTQFADAMKMTAMRIVYGTRIFNIQSSVDRHEAHRWLNLSCSEGLNDG
ncbi:hypothetical protein BA896_012700 [Janthinobacterium lividum]|uniref:Head-tail adaptor protein n=1 Tax=Janthinobacterium lividum TaxID=29581 RepID=A0A1E8PU28_9BURK|nr:hypothetical protein BA896_012700 [Janthinobacterium lividum]